MTNIQGQSMKYFYIAGTIADNEGSTAFISESS